MDKVNIYGKNISNDFELKIFLQKNCLIYLEKIFWKGKRLVHIKSAVLQIVEVTADTSRTENVLIILFHFQNPVWNFEKVKFQTIRWKNILKIV